MLNHRAAVRLLVVLLGILATGCFSSSPETPGNAVIDFVVARQMGHEESAVARVCSQARDEGRDLPFGYEQLGQEPDYHGTGVVSVSGAEATVFGDMATEGGFDYETWAFDLVKEDGRWRVCQVRDPTPDERSSVDLGRERPPPTYRRTMCEAEPTANGCPQDLTITVPAGCTVPPAFDAFGRTWEYREGERFRPGVHAGQVYWASDDMTFVHEDGSLTRFASVDSAVPRDSCD